jgi:hypothetical protein
VVAVRIGLKINIFNNFPTFGHSTTCNSTLKRRPNIFFRRRTCSGKFASIAWTGCRTSCPGSSTAWTMTRDRFYKSEFFSDIFVIMGISSQNSKKIHNSY